LLGLLRMVLARFRNVSILREIATLDAEWSEEPYVMTIEVLFVLPAPAACSNRGNHFHGRVLPWVNSSDLPRPAGQFYPLGDRLWWPSNNWKHPFGKAATWSGSTDAAAVAPFGKAARGVEIRLARLVVIDLRGEEFQNAPGGLGRLG